jgi:hypothetical protein
MPVPLKPPRGAFIASTVLFHAELRPAVKDTLIQLVGLAWRSNGGATPPLSYNQLSHLTGKPVKTLYGHIAVLRDTHAALRMQDAGDGMVIFTFAEWVKPARMHAGVISENPEMPVKEEEQELILSNSRKNLLLNDQAETHPQKRIHPRLKKTGPKGVALPRKLQSALLDAGLFPVLLDEVAASGRSEKDIGALLAWAAHDQPANPAPLFVARLRAGARPPHAYRTDGCSMCGESGTHSSTCPLRYLDDPYAEFIEH